MVQRAVQQAPPGPGAATGDRLARPAQLSWKPWRRTRLDDRPDSAGYLSGGGKAKPGGPGGDPPAGPPRAGKVKPDDIDMDALMSVINRRLRIDFRIDRERLGRLRDTTR